VSVAVRLASPGRLVVVHAHEPAAPHVSARWQQLLQEDAARRSPALLGELMDATGTEVGDLDLELWSMGGRPVSALLEAAEVDRSVGTRGIGETTTFVGSVALGLVEASKRPMLVVPPRPRAAP
jgi:hypothetical protein